MPDGGMQRSQENNMKTLTQQQWFADGEERFGPDKRNWAFRCPACGRVATVKQWLDANKEMCAAGADCLRCDHSADVDEDSCPVRVIMPDGTELAMFAWAD